MQRAAEQFEEQEEGGGALSLDRAMSAVRKRSKLVLAMPVVAALLTSAIVMMMPNRYEAAAVVQIDPRQKSITNLEGVISDLRGDQPTVESEVEIVKSRPIILKVIAALDLRNDPEFSQPSLRSRFFAMLGFGAADPKATRTSQRTPDPIADMLKVDEPGMSRPEKDEVADAFFQRLKASRVRNTLLIDIRFTASESAKAARIVNTIAEVYLKDQLDSKTHAASTATVLLEDKLEEMRKKVADAEHKVEAWKAEHNVFDSEGQVLSEKQMTRLMEQSVTARNATSEAKAKYEQAQKLARAGDSGTAIVEVLQSGTVRTLKEQLATVTRKVAELRSKYGPKHPDIIKAEAELAQAESQLNSEIGRLVANLKNEAETAEERERQLTQSLNQMKDQQIVSKDASVELKDLEREAATSKQLFEALLVRYKQTAETQGFQLPDVRIIEKADAPQYPASPKRRQLVAMAAAFGLVLGVALAVLLEMMAPGITRHEDVERVFDAAHLSSVPAQGSPDEPVTAARAVRLVVAEPSSQYADAIRSARRELDVRRTSQAPRIILVTSSVAGEGAELIASNLAHNYAMTGSRPLLIDGDLRLQPLTRQLASQRQRGLLDQILMRQPIEAAILRDGLTGLHFLPATGPKPLQASIPETLGSETLARAISGLKVQFDTIIISVPPLLPVIDGRILADYADQIVFVVAWQKTPKQIAKSALKTLGMNGSKLAGIILNDVAPDALNESRGWPRDILGGRFSALRGATAQYAA
jgi:succinoglycan biosynthesis transport protein ExoP